MKTSARTTPRTEMDAETALLDAEYLAELLEKNPKATTRLFGRGLTALARELRLAIIAEASHEELLRIHLRLEATMRMAYAEVLTPDRDPDVEPASQRPTVPYPVDFPSAPRAFDLADASLPATEMQESDECDREVPTVRYPRPISEIRRRASLPIPPAAPRKPIGWARALRR